MSRTTRAGGWSKERPTAPGPYWNKRSKSELWEFDNEEYRVLVIIEGPHGKLEVNCQGDTELENYTGEWQPVPAPRE